MTIADDEAAIDAAAVDAISAEARAALVGTLSNGNRAKTASAPLVAVLSYDTSWHEQWDTFLPGYKAPKAMYDSAPDLAAATGNNTPTCRPATSSSPSGPSAFPPAHDGRGLHRN